MHDEMQHLDVYPCVLGTMGYFSGRGEPVENVRSCGMFPTFVSHRVRRSPSVRLQAFGGGPLSIKVGNTLSAAGVPIVTGFGATECGIITTIPSREDIADGDWLWFRFADGIDVRWIPEDDDMYECHVLVGASFDFSILGDSRPSRAQMDIQSP